MPAQAVLLFGGERSRIEQERLLIRTNLVPNALLSIPLDHRLRINFARDHHHTLKDDCPDRDLMGRERARFIVVLNDWRGRSCRNSERLRPFLCRRSPPGFISLCHSPNLCRPLRIETNLEVVTHSPGVTNPGFPA